MTPPRIGLIACSKGKRKEAAAAKDLYTSPLFVAQRQYIEARCGRWFILSARYGLLLPDRVVNPYDETLNTTSPSQLMLWSQGVIEQLTRELPNRSHIVLLAGEKYRKHLVPWLLRHNTVEQPLKRLGIGSQLAFLKRANAEPLYTIKDGLS